MAHIEAGLCLQPGPVPVPGHTDPESLTVGCAPMGGCIWGHLDGLHAQGVVFQAFSTIRFSGPGSLQLFFLGLRGAPAQWG